MNPYFETSINKAAETRRETRALLANLSLQTHQSGQDESERQFCELQPSLAGEVQKPRQSHSSCSECCS